MSIAVATRTADVGGRIDGRFVAAALLPFGTAVIQWLLWPWIQPFVWFLFFPTVFLGAWIGGFRGGLACTLVSVGVVWYVFLPPELSWKLDGLQHYWSVPLFVLMGFLVSRMQSRLEQAQGRLSVALTDAQSANVSLARLYERTRASGLESRGRFEATFDQAAVGMALVAQDGRWLRVNRRLCEIVGYDAEALLALTVQEITHPDDLAAGRQVVAQLLDRSLASGRLQTRYLRRDGSEVWIDLTIALAGTREGGAEEFVAVVEDITTRKRAEDALKDSELRFRRIFEHVATGIAVTDLAGRYVQCNPAFSALCGYGEDELRGLDRARLIHPEDLPDNVEGVRRLVAGEIDAYQVENRFVHRDGRDVWVRKYVSLLPGGDGQPANVMALVTDMTERRAAEASLRDSRERLQTFIRFAPISIAMFDRNLNCLAASGQWTKEFGRGHADLVGLNHYDLHPDLPDAWKEVHRRGLAGATIRHDDDLWVQADGTRMWLRWAVLPWLDDQGAVGGIIMSSENITERRQVEEALKENRALLSGIVDSAMDAIISVDLDQRIRLFNPAAGRIFDVDPQSVIGEPLTRFIPLRYRAGHGEHLKHFGLTGVTARRMGALGEVSGLRANGEEFPLEASISRVGSAGGGTFTVILRDLTERKRAETALNELRREMDRTLKLQVASETASAIAHELNQPLNAVTSYSEAAIRLLRAGNPKPDRLLHAIAGSAEQAQRAGRVMRELMGFLHKSDAPAEVVDLQIAVERAISVVAGGGTDRGMIHVSLLPGLGPVHGQHVRIEKVLVNLIRNAAEAMAAAGTSDPEIRIRLGALDEHTAHVEVSDTGPGLTDEMVHHVFDPFYTTKPRGVGMGLAISRSLVESQGGRLWVEGRVGAGATFHFTLPFAG